MTNSFGLTQALSVSSPPYAMMRYNLPHQVQAAYHLEIKPLVDLTCQAIAQLLKGGRPSCGADSPDVLAGKSPAEIRRTFNILYDFNPEDDGMQNRVREKLMPVSAASDHSRQVAQQALQPQSQREERKGGR